MRGKDENYVWTYTTDDKYELPLVVADSAKELGEMLNLDGNAVRSALCHAVKRGTNCRYHKIYVGDLDDEVD